MRTLLRISSYGCRLEKRNYQWLNNIWNLVSKKRLKEVGPDRACAEWLMRNGAFIRWKGSDEFVPHYNNLPLDPDVKGNFFVEEIKASNASLTSLGFEHLKGCSHIKQISFRDCLYIDDKCLKKLEYVAETLTEFEVCKCGEITDRGLVDAIVQLRKLKIFRVGNLLSVKDLDACIGKITRSMPKLDVDVMSSNAVC